MTFLNILYATILIDYHLVFPKYIEWSTYFPWHDPIWSFDQPPFQLKKFVLIFRLEIEQVFPSGILQWKTIKFKVFYSRVFIQYPIQCLHQGIRVHA